MDRTKKVYVLLGVLAAVSFGAFAISKYEEHKENIQNSDEVVLNIDPDSVTALSFKNETTELSFTKGDGWTYDEDSAFPVDEDKINELLSVFEDFGVSFTVEDVEDYSQYGLDDPVAVISITTEDETYEIKLGDFSKMDSQRYVSIGDGNVYLVTTDPLDEYSAELPDMLKDDEIPSWDQVTSLTFKGECAYTFNYEEDSNASYDADDVYFISDGNEKLNLDTTLVESYTNTIKNLTLSDYVSYNATDDDLETYGLDDPDLTMNITYEMVDSEGTFVLHIARNPSEDEEDEVENAYARVDDSRIIYVLSADDYTDLMKASYNDLRHQELYYGDFEDLTGMNVTVDGETYTLSGDDDTWSYNDEKIDTADLESALEALTVNEFTDEDTDGKEEIAFTLYLDNESFPEITIQLYRYDGDNCIAKVDGETIGLVSRSALVDFQEAIYAIIL